MINTLFVFYIAKMVRKSGKNWEKYFILEKNTQEFTLNVFIYVLPKKKGLSKKSVPYFFNLQFVSLQKNLIQ